MVNPFRRCKSGLPTCLSLAAILFHSVALGFSQQPDKSLVSLMECWRNTSIRVGRFKPAFDENDLYLAEPGGRLSAISVETGKLIWSTELGGEIRSNVAVLGSSVYIVAGPATDGKPNGIGSLRALSASTGVPSVDVPLTGTEVRLIPAAGRIVILTPNGLIECFENGGRVLAWQRNVPQVKLESAIAWNDKLVLATADMKVHVISVATGTDLSVVPTQHQVSALGVIDEDIVWGDERGEIVRYDLAKNNVYWRFKNGARISGLAPTDEGIAAASLDNFTYFISSYYGSVRWKKRLPGRVEGITPYGRDIVVVQTVGEPTATLISVEDGKSVSQVSVEQDLFIGPPLDAGGRLIFFTNHMVLAQSATPCSSK